MDNISMNNSFYHMRFTKPSGAYLLETHVQNFGHSIESTHDGIEFISLRSPHLIFWPQTLSIELRPDSLLVLNAQEKHTEFYPSNLKSIYRSITVYSELSKKVLADENLKASEIVFKPEAHFGLFKIQAGINEAFSNWYNKDASDLLEPLLMDLLVEALLILPHSHSQLLRTSHGRGYFPKTVHNAIRFIQRERRNPHLDLDEVAKKVGMSKFQLIRNFKKDVGLSPMQYLKALRAHEARDLLRLGHLSLSDIAENVGFLSTRNLRYAIQWTFGLNPQSADLNRKPDFGPPLMSLCHDLFLRPVMPSSQSDEIKIPPGANLRPLF